MDRNRSSLTIQAAAPLVGAGLVAFVSTLASVPGVDLWWQMAAGRLIWTTGAVPTADPFSFTARGRPWLVHEWVPDVLFYLIYTHLGPTWLVILKAAVIGTALVLVLALALRASGRPWLAALLTCFAALGGNYFWDIRPQMFTYLLIAVFLFLIDDFRRSGTNTSLWAMAILTGLWANLHGGFIIGPVLIAAYMIGDLLDYIVRGEKHSGKSIGLAVPILGGLLFSLLNPNGYHILLYPFRLTGHPHVLDFIVEWFSPNFHDDGYRIFELLLLTTIAALAWGRAAYRTADLLVILLAVHLSLYSVRHIPLFLIAATPIMARYLAVAVGEFDQDEFRSACLSAATAALGFVIAVGVLWPLRGQPLFDWTIEAETFPRDAVRYIRRARLDGPMWNEYRWGGYLIWHLPQHPVFIDGRAEVYYNGPFEDFTDIHRVKPNWQVLLDKYKVQFALVDSSAVLARTMEVSPHWRTVYRDRVATVFVRTTTVPGRVRGTSPPGRPAEASAPSLAGRQ
ncbi:MAG: hypothetical protein ACUVTZ_01945 [Armatimonadota bacterium]